ncbi:MAG: RDD family protein [Planctomycetota bacterium]|nr:MAG: RDD family protein [Planctomycetota bacterium]
MIRCTRLSLVRLTLPVALTLTAPLSTVAQPASALQPSLRPALPPVRNTPAIAGVGGARHAFLAIRQQAQPPSRPSAPAVPPQPLPPHWRLYHLPAHEQPGSVFTMGDRSLSQPPDAWTVAGDSLVLFFNEQLEDGSVICRVRRLTARQSTTLGMYTYEPAGRFEALTPLPQGLLVLAAAASDAGELFVIAQRLPMGDVAAPAALSQQLTALRRAPSSQRWTELRTPPGATLLRRPFAAGSLAATRKALYLLDAAGSLWRLDLASRSDAQRPPAWTRAVTGLDPHGLLFAAPAQLLYVHRADSGELLVQTLRNDLRANLATLQAPARAAVLLLGEQLHVAWTDPANQGRLRITAVDANTGRIVYNDFARTASPISPQDVRMIALLAAAALIAALLFALRPEEQLRTAPALLQKRTLAPPSRRLAAAMVDIAPAAALASAIFSVSPLHAMGLPTLQGEAAPMLPPLLTLALWFAHSAISEWLLAGKTLGKAALRIRTLSQTGTPPTLRQAFVRSAVKALAPPITALLLIDPLRRHPGDMLASTLVVLDAEALPTDEAEQPRDAAAPADSSAQR